MAIMTKQAFEETLVQVCLTIKQAGDTLTELCAAAAYYAITERDSTLANRILASWTRQSDLPTIRAWFVQNVGMTEVKDKDITLSNGGSFVLKYAVKFSEKGWERASASLVPGKTLSAEQAYSVFEVKNLYDFKATRQPAKAKVEKTKEEVKKDLEAKVQKLHEQASEAGISLPKIEKSYSFGVKDLVKQILAKALDKDLAPEDKAFIAAISAAATAYLNK